VRPGGGVGKGSRVGRVGGIDLSGPGGHLPAAEALSRFAQTGIHKYINIYINIHIFIYLHIYEFIYIPDLGDIYRLPRHSVDLLKLVIYINIYMHIDIYMYLCMYIYIYIYIYLYIYTRPGGHLPAAATLCRFAQTGESICIYIYIYTYVYIYIYMYVYARRMGQPTQRATNYNARSNIDTAQTFLHANGQRPKRAMIRQRSRRRQRRGEPHTEHGLGILLTHTAASMERDRRKNLYM